MLAVAAVLAMELFQHLDQAVVWVVVELVVLQQEFLELLT
jgi:hypothetical protein